jgi:very-short-patch-repair endonuclease
MCKKYIRTEIQIVGFAREFLTTLKIPFEFQKKVNNFRNDLYLTEQSIAIEIDENGRKDRRDPHEQQREKTIAGVLGCKFLRFNPDEVGFIMSRCVATIPHYILRSKYFVDSIYYSSHFLILRGMTQGITTRQTITT